MWLWSVLEPQRLTRRVEKALADPANELWLSPVSVAELTVLLRKGRLTLPHDIQIWVTKTVQHLQLTEAPLTIEVARAISTIKFPHGDKADQLRSASGKGVNTTLA